MFPDYATTEAELAHIVLRRRGGNRKTGLGGILPMMMTSAASLDLGKASLLMLAENSSEATV